jgi:hypothetical protein
VTFTNSGTNGLQAGEQVTFGASQDRMPPSAGTTQTIFSTSALHLLRGAGNRGQPDQRSFTGTATPVSGNFSSLRFVFMNEVSTEALAVAMAPFTCGQFHAE